METTFTPVGGILWTRWGEAFAVSADHSRAWPVLMAEDRAAEVGLVADVRMSADEAKERYARWPALLAAYHGLTALQHPGGQI
jgi:hypothetical protein